MSKYGLENSAIAVIVHFDRCIEQRFTCKFNYPAVWLNGIDRDQRMRGHVVAAKNAVRNDGFIKSKLGQFA
ncbi:MAG: hypothetical protein HYX49_13290 [Chloroflexi bacterium]|nr:hypothetical protein [Chloroflexota bacterium]